MGLFDSAFGGIVSGLGGIVSSIFGNKAQRDANKANMQIAQMNNEWSERMMDKQNQMNIAQWQREAQFAKKQAQSANAFTEYMQDKANKYNSAQAQAERLRQAGLNPALAMSGQNAGSASGASGAQAGTPSGNSLGLPSPSQAQVRPYDYSGFSRAIIDAVMFTLQAQKQLAEVKNVQLQNEFLRKSMENRLSQEYEKMRSQKYDTDYRETMENIRASTENEHYLNALTTRLLGQEQITLVKEQQALMKIQKENLPDQMQADIAFKLATAEYAGTTDLAKDLKFFEKKYNRKLTRDELRTIFDAWKQNIIYSPTRGMSPSGAAATIGNVIGNWIKR